MCNLRHIGITVTDIDKSLEFYKNVFDLEVVYDKKEFGNVISNFSKLNNVMVHIIKLKDKNNFILELLQYITHPKDFLKNQKELINEIGCSHFAITVKNIDKILYNIEKRNCEVMYPIQRSSDGKVDLMFVRDPDGTLIEIVEDIL